MPAKSKKTEIKNNSNIIADSDKPPLSDFKKSLDELSFRWNPELLCDIVALPSRVIDSELKFASGDQIKVLLWFSRHTGESFSSEKCSKSTGVKPNACLDALDYWVSRAIILPTGDLMPALSPYPAPAVDLCGLEKAAAKSNGAYNSEDKSIQSEDTVNKSTLSINSVRPTTKDVLKKQKSSKEFAFLLNEASARLGKPINHGDMETLLYLFDTVKQPAEVILLIIVYAVSVGKGNMRYIEKVALDWTEKEICTVESAEQYLCALERKTTAWEKVCEILKIEKKPTASDLNASERWIYEWKFNPDIIRVAYEICIAKIEKFRSGYIDKILSGWHLDGVDSVEKALEQIDPKNKKPSFAPSGDKGKSKKNSADKELSFDFDEYDKMVASFVPVYKKKEE